MPFSPRRRLSSRAIAPGRYVTDGHTLLRVVSNFDDGRSVMALLEDCCTLDAFAYALVELRAMGFRGVRITLPRPAGESSAVPAGQAAG